MTKRRAPSRAMPKREDWDEDHAPRIGNAPTPYRKPKHEIAIAATRDGGIAFGIAHAGTILAGAKTTRAEFLRLLTHAADVARTTGVTDAELCAALGVEYADAPPPRSVASDNRIVSACTVCGEEIHLFRQTQLHLCDFHLRERQKDYNRDYRAMRMGKVPEDRSPRACIECGETFTPGKRGTVSERCRPCIHRHNKRQQLERKLNGTNAPRCDNCGEPTISRFRARSNGKPICGACRLTVRYWVAMPPVEARS